MVFTLLAILVIVAFVGAGGLKLFNAPASVEIRDSLDVPPGLWRLIGVFEWLGAAGVGAGLAYPSLGLLASIGLTCLMVGAVVTRLRAAQRHGRSETVGVVIDSSIMILVIVTAVVFASRL